MQDKQMIYLNSYVKTFALLPFYISSALLISQLNLFFWFFMVILLLYVSHYCYCWVFLGSKAKPSVLLIKYLAIIFCQYAILGGLMLID